MYEFVEITGLIAAGFYGFAWMQSGSILQQIATLPLCESLVRHI